MRTKLLPLAAASALLVAAASCSDDDTTTEVTSAPRAGTVADTPTTSESLDIATTEPGTDAVLTGFAGSWKPEHVEGIELTEANTIPVIDSALADERVAPDHWVWDWWPVRDRDGEVADIDGWHIAIALAAPADILPGKRHDVATHRYLLSDDGGRTWTDGGELFSGDLLGTRQWAGSAMFDEETDTLYAFYTAAGEDDANESDTSSETDATVTTTTNATATETTTTATMTTETTTTTTSNGGTTTETTTDTDTDSDDAGDRQAPSGGSLDDDISYRQQLALATATISVVDGEVRFDEWSDHEVLLTGEDTDLYATTQATEGGAGQIDAFRDPWYHRDEATGEEYLLFTATMPRAECDGDGVIGIARATDEDLREWELLPPMLDGHCVNNELERPHIVIDGGLTYLLFTTHSHTFRDGTWGPEGLYGFVADDLLGPYEPLNGTGLVLANPQEAPYQAYSWMTLPNGIATSFFQFFDIDGDVEISYIGEQSPDFQREHFGGTFAPSLLIRFDGDRTEFVEELAPGQLVP
jgi:levansucrase